MPTYEFNFPENVICRFVTTRKIGLQEPLWLQEPLLIASPHMGSIPMEAYEDNEIILPTFESARMDKAIGLLRHKADDMNLQHIHLVRRGNEIGAFAYHILCKEKH